MKTLSLTALALALCASTAVAQDTGRYAAGVRVGATVPTGDFGDGADPSFAMGGWVEGPLMGSLNWVGEYSYNRFAPSDAQSLICILAGVDCEDATINHFGGGVMFSGGSAESSLKPYGLFTVGAYNAGSFVGGDSNTYFGIGFGGGINFYIGENWGLGGDLHIHGVRDGDFDVWNWYMVPAGQVFFSF